MYLIAACVLAVVDALAIAALAAVVFRRQRVGPGRDVAAGDDVVVSGLAARVLHVDGEWIKLRLTWESGSPIVTAPRSAVIARWTDAR